MSKKYQGDSGSSTSAANNNNRGQVSKGPAYDRIFGQQNRRVSIKYFYTFRKGRRKEERAGVSWLSDHGKRRAPRRRQNSILSISCEMEVRRSEEACQVAAAARAILTGDPSLKEDEADGGGGRHFRSN